MVEAQLLRQDEGLAGGHHGGAQDHVVANLGRLPRPRAAAMDDALAHGLQHRLASGEGLHRSPAHEGQRARHGAARAAGDRGVQRQQALGARQLMHGPRALHIDGGGIDQQRPLGNRARDLLPDRPHMLARRQHGDDDLRPPHAVQRAIGQHKTRRRGRLTRGWRQIKTRHPMARPHKIERHRQAHVAEPDECDCRHSSLPLNAPRVRAPRSGA